jgi:protein gp37
MIFVNSMSDLFHEDIPAGYIEQVFEVMGQAHWHTFQILTKRHERLAELAPSLTWHQDSTKAGSDQYPDYRCRIRDPQPEGGVMPRKNIDPEASFSF